MMEGSDSWNLVLVNCFFACIFISLQSVYSQGQYVIILVESLKLSLELSMKGSMIILVSNKVPIAFIESPVDVGYKCLEPVLHVYIMI